MATNKDRVIKGVRFLALAFPFIFLGPSLHFWLGPEAPSVWKIFAFMLMGVGVFYAVKGLLTILNGLFEGGNAPDKKSD